MHLMLSIILLVPMEYLYHTHGNDEILTATKKIDEHSIANEKWTK